MAQRCQCNEHPQPPAGTKNPPSKTNNQKLLPSATTNNAPITKPPPRPETHKLHASKRDKIWNPQLAPSTRTNRGEKKPMRGGITDRVGRIVGKKARGGEGSGATSLFLRVPDTCRAWMRACMDGWWASMPHGIISPSCYVYPPIHNIHILLTYMCPQPTWCGHLIS
jgi:hypothetical protein